MFSASRTYNSSSPTPFDEAKRAVQILFLNFKNEGNGPVGEGSSATVLCRIVDKTANAPGEPTKPSAAARYRASVVLWSVVVISAVVVLML